jgi:surfactin synthase thioesterase subunit
VLATVPNYNASAQNTRVVGAHVAELIDFLVAQTGAKLEDFHIIGHSLGGHVAGFAGKSTTTGKVARITGLYWSVEETFVGLGPSYSVSNVYFQISVY